MEIKNGKQYLPQTYESYLALKKKSGKGVSLYQKAGSVS